MKFKKYNLILFATLASLSNIFVDPIKSEENVCYYSKPDEYLKCIKSKSFKIHPKYPLEIGDFNFLWRLCPNKEYSCLNIQKRHPVYKLTSKDDLSLKISIGNQGNLSFLPFRENNYFTVTGENIIKWSKKSLDESGLTKNIYNISYFDELYKVRYIDFYVWSHPNIFNDKIIEILIKDVSQLSNLEERDLIPSLKKLEKKIEIIRSIISKAKLSKENCFIADDDIYPDLVENYSELYKSINYLRAKLSITPSNTIKPICN